MSKQPVQASKAPPGGAPPPQLLASLHAAEQVLDSDPAEAARRARAILRICPGLSPATAILGAARRRQGRAAEARSVLAPLARAAPGDGLVQYELGEALVALGRRDAALAAFRRAVATRPALGRGWRALGDRLQAAGDPVGADEAYGRYVACPIDDPVLVQAARALQGGDPAAAERLLLRHLETAAGDVVAMVMLANVWFNRGRLEAADRILAVALERHPAYANAQTVRAAIRARIPSSAAEAVAAQDAAVAAAPADASTRLTLARSLLALGEANLACAVLEAGVAGGEPEPRLWAALGEARKFAGRGADAVSAFRKALDIDPSAAEAWFGLADLKSHAFSEADVVAMEQRLAGGALDDTGRVFLNYALARAREDAGDYALAFAHYAAGAAIRRRQAPHSAEALTALVRRKTALFTPAFFAEREAGGSPDEAPIFILGLQRSGSTLVEQILASHSAVEGASELPYIRDIANRIVDLATSPGLKPYPERLADLSPSDRLDLANTYLSRAAAHLKLGRPRFLDKNPGNFEHTGLICLLFPKARIIDVRRHPLAAGAALFRQHFGEAGSFSYDLGEIGQAYRDYVALMGQFDRALPGRVLRVIYEELVEDTEGQVRRMLDHCGLPFETGCLAFHSNARAVTTPSAQQVRRPIYRDSLELWRAYEPWLGPLKTALGPVLESWRDGP